jgi:hypothetical protein
VTGGTQIRISFVAHAGTTRQDDRVISWGWLLMRARHSTVLPCLFLDSTARRCALLISTLRPCVYLLSLERPQRPADSGDDVVKSPLRLLRIHQVEAMDRAAGRPPRNCSGYKNPALVGRGVRNVGHIAIGVVGPATSPHKKKPRMSPSGAFLCRRSIEASGPPERPREFTTRVRRPARSRAAAAIG